MADAKIGARTIGKSKLNRAASAKSLGVAAKSLGVAIRSLGVAPYGVGGEDKCVAGDKLNDISFAVAHGACFLNLLS